MPVINIEAPFLHARNYLVYDGWEWSCFRMKFPNWIKYIEKYQQLNIWIIPMNL